MEVYIYSTDLEYTLVLFTSKKVNYVQTNQNGGKIFLSHAVSVLTPNSIAHVWNDKANYVLLVQLYIAVTWKRDFV